jgi:eukaryotic-like serine/threonine-protein kinase
MKRSALSAAIVAAVAVVVVAGCGSSHTATPSSTPSSGVTTASTAPGRSTTSLAAASTTAGGAVPTTGAAVTSLPATTAAPTTTAPATTTVPTTASASTSTTSVASGVVKVIADCQNPAYEPTTIILACADGGITATQISWTSWGATSATGTSVIQANLCNPNCAQGTMGSFPANITLSSVTSGSGGGLFSTLTAVFTGASPTGSPTQTFSISAIG